jgi:uncharacterized membrane protein
MNKMLVAVFDNETTAQAGLQALHKLHTLGDITLYATGVLAKDGQGMVTVKKSMDSDPIGTGVGLAVGSLIGLLGGPVGMAVGAMTGTVVGAVRDFWVAGVGLDFIEEAEKMLLPGKVALVAEIEEEWTVPADHALEAAGGLVFRRTRSEVAEAQFDHDIATFHAEIKALESEASHAKGATQLQLQAKLALARTHLAGAVHRAQQRVETLKREADAKAAALKLQMGEVRSEVRTKIEDRVSRVRSAYHARGTKLARAWSLTKEALAV